MTKDIRRFDGTYMCGFTMYGVMRKNFHILKTINDGRLAIIQHDHHAHGTLQAPCSVDTQEYSIFNAVGTML